jgi:aminopeptidase N
VRSRWALLAVLLVVLLVGGVGIWVSRDGGGSAAQTGQASSGLASPSQASPGQASPSRANPGAPLSAELTVAESRPREDSYYPRVGDPGVDALHYDLDLTWDPAATVLTGVETLVFRSTTDADTVRLDLGEPLDVTTLELDGAPADFDHTGKDLVVHTPVRTDEQYTLRLTYSGTPEPVRAPTMRSDFSTTGWTTTPSGATWTMQEPYGAYTWYAVNDQPADKALYDFRLTVPAPWTGVANGTLTGRDVVDAQTVTSFHLDEPAASYLITVAFGDYTRRSDETSSGTPLTYWALRSQKSTFRQLRYARPAIEWIQGKLGPYPFSSGGILLTESRSGMETQTLVTLGNTAYTRSREVIVHEMVHQWYGDLVTPTDWRDLWMNEGMTMYLQLVYRAETKGRPIDKVMDGVAAYDQVYRDQAGPPGKYAAGSFGQGNVYYCPALMWHELRHRLGDEVFWRLAREWPRTEAYGNADRQQLYDWWERESGQELTSFFDAWIMGTTTPPRT